MAAIRSVVVLGWGRQGGAGIGITVWHKDLCGIMDMFITLIVNIYKQLSNCTLYICAVYCMSVMIQRSFFLIFYFKKKFTLTSRIHIQNVQVSYTGIHMLLSF